MTSESGVIDMRGYVMPAMELVYERMMPRFRGQWPAIEERLELAMPLVGHGDWEAPYLELPSTPQPRGQAVRTTAAKRVQGAKLATGMLHDNPTGRLAALDEAGIAKQIISPGSTIDACIGLPSNVAAGVLGAYNRYILSYCEADAQRLGAVLQVHGSEPPWSAREILDLAGEPGIAGVSICLPVRISPEERSFLPIWSALEETGLPFVHRWSFGARVWTPARLMNYLTLAGVLEKFEGLRIAFLDSEPSALEDLLPYLGEVDGESRSEDLIDPERVMLAAPAERVGEWSRRVQGQDAGGCMAWESGFPLSGGLETPMLEMKAIPTQIRQRIMVENPQRFLP